MNPLRLLIRLFSDNSRNKHPESKEKPETHNIRNSTDKHLSEEIQYHKAIINELRRDLDFLRNILHNSDQGFLVLDKNLKIKLINNTLLRKIGLVQDYSRYIDRDVLEIIRFPIFFETIQTLSLEDKPKSIHITSDTTNTDFEVVLKFINNHDEIFLLTYWNDITKLNKAEKLGRDLIANVAHQLRTPLTSIKGYTETLLDNTTNDPNITRRFLEIILKNADRLSNLVRDILTLTRLDDKSIAPKFSKVEINSIIKNLVEQFDNLAKEKNVRILTYLPDHPVFVLGSQQDIEIAITNLIDNAVKFTSPNTQVEIRVNQVQDKTIISIKDYGFGIPQSDLERIFERFYRAEDAKSRKIAGTGLGLSIVKEIAKLHNGRTWAESIWGSGATFYLELNTYVEEGLPGSKTASSLQKETAPSYVLDPY